MRSTIDTLQRSMWRDGCLVAATRAPEAATVWPWVHFALQPTRRMERGMVGSRTEWVGDTGSRALRHGLSTVDGSTH